MGETLYQFLERRQQELHDELDAMLERTKAVGRELEHVQQAIELVALMNEEAGDDEPEIDAQSNEAAQPAETAAVAAPQQAAEIIPDPIPSDDEGQAGGIPKLILRFLPAWMDKFSGGPTISQVRDETKLDARDIKAAFDALRVTGDAVIYQHHETRALRVAPLGFEPEPIPELSRNQEAVLGYLSALPEEPDGTVEPPSRAHMHDRSGVAAGSLGAAIDDLERKGKIAVVKPGRGGVTLQKPRYKVVDRQLLRQALGRPAGVLPVEIMGDPGPGRSALDEKIAEKIARHDA